MSLNQRKVHIWILKILGLWEADKQDKGQVGCKNSAGKLGLFRLPSKDFPISLPRLTQLFLMIMSYIHMPRGENWEMAKIIIIGKGVKWASLGHIPRSWRLVKGCMTLIERMALIHPKEFWPIFWLSFLLKTSERLIDKYIRDRVIVKNLSIHGWQICWNSTTGARNIKCIGKKGESNWSLRGYWANFNKTTFRSMNDIIAN